MGKLQSALAYRGYSPR
ncbi:MULTISPECIES: hypothetical protein [Photorhabdus]